MHARAVRAGRSARVGRPPACDFERRAGFTPLKNYLKVSFDTQDRQATAGGNSEKRNDGVESFERKGGKLKRREKKKRRVVFRNTGG